MDLMRKLGFLLRKASKKIDQDRQRRLMKIISILEDEGVVGASKLTATLEIPKSELQADLAYLQEQGILQITAHGGAVLTQYSKEEPFDKREQVDARIKNLLAREAVDRFCPSGSKVLVHGSTSVLKMIPYLKEIHLEIHTNSLLFAIQSRESDIAPDIFCSPGKLRFISGNLVGQRTLDYFDSIQAEVAFVGMHGINQELKFKDPIAEEVAVKQAMIRNTKKVVVITDSRKFGADSLLTVAEPEEVDVLITDTQANPEMVNRLKDKNIEVIQVKV